MSYDGMTDSLGQSQVLPYLVGLSSLGIKFTLISFEKDDRLAENEDLVQEICDANKIDWIPLRYHANPAVLSTLYDVRILRKAVARVIAEKEIHLIHCRSYVTSIVGLWAKKQYGVDFIFDMRGFYADERVDGNLWKMNNPVYAWTYKYFKKKELQFYQESKRIVVLTQKAKDYIESNAMLENDKIAVIPCCADEKLFNPENYNKGSKRLREELELPAEGRILLYVGSVGTWYLLPEMMDFFRLYLKRFVDAKFLFLSNDDSQMILKEASRAGVEEEHIIIRSSRRQNVPKYIMASDEAIYFIKPVFSKMASSATKQAELMLMDKVIVSNSGVGDVDLIFNSYNKGLLLNEFSNEQYSKIIDKITTQEEKDNDINNLSNFFTTTGVQKYLEVYQALDAKG